MSVSGVNSVFIVFYVFNGYSALQANASNLIRANLKDQEYLDAYLILHILIAVLLSLAGTFTVWRISRKILLITGFFIMF